MQPALAVVTRGPLPPQKMLLHFWSVAWCVYWTKLDEIPVVHVWAPCVGNATLWIVGWQQRSLGLIISVLTRVNVQFKLLNEGDLSSSQYNFFVRHMHAHCSAGTPGSCTNGGINERPATALSFFF
jgi:hypothetical protein